MKTRSISTVSRRRGPLALAVAAVLGTGGGLIANAALPPGDTLGGPTTLAEVGDDYSVFGFAYPLESPYQYPVVALDADGDGVVAWQAKFFVNGDGTFPEPGDHQGIYFRRIQKDGSLGDVVAVTETADMAIDIEDIGIAVDADGDAVVTWMEYSNPGARMYSIWSRRIDAEDAPAGAAIAVVANDVNEVLDPSVGTDAAGNFVVAWAAETATENEYDILFRRYDASGDPLPEGVQQANIVSAYNEHTEVAVSAKGDFVVAWSQDSFEIAARSYTAAGDAVDAAQFVVADPTMVVRTFHVVVDADGDAAFAWPDLLQNDEDPPSYEYRVFVTRVSSTGTPLLDDTVLDTPEIWPAGVRFDADGNVIVAWNGKVDVLGTVESQTGLSVVQADGTESALTLLETTCSNEGEADCLTPAEKFAFDADGDMLKLYGLGELGASPASLNVQRFQGLEPADLALTLALSPDQVDAGDIVELSLTVENLHPLGSRYGVAEMDAAAGAASGVQVEFELPAAFDIEADTGDWVCESVAETTILCSHPEQLFAAGELVFETSFEIPVTAPVGDYTFGVSVSANPLDPDTDNNTSEATFALESEDVPPANEGGDDDGTDSDGNGDGNGNGNGNNGGSGDTGNGNTPPPIDSGGGGVFGWLGLLGLMSFVRRRRNSSSN